MARAQPGPDRLISLEWLAADSPLIVRGRVLSAEPIEDSYRGHKVVLRVEETLKGEKQKELTFDATFIVLPQDPAPRWAAKGADVLAFLVQSKSPLNGLPNPPEPRYPYRPYGGRADLAMFELDRTAGTQVLSMGLEPLSDPADILRRTKEAVKFRPPKGGPQMWSLQLPGLKDVPDHASGGMGTLLAVPVDSRLERFARGWTTSRDGPTRTIGVEGLAFFKSADNIAHVKRLLDDRFTLNYMLQDRGPGLAVRPVREAAKDVLDRWDVPWESVHRDSMDAAKQMIRVPAGEFIAGGTDGAQDAGPAHRVRLDEYWIGRTAVTVSQYRAFCKATGYRYDWKAYRPNHGYKDDHPMVMMTWQDARAFCKWVGGDLPTEDQWEKAARGTDGRRFPWGNEWDSKRLQCWENTLDRWRATAPVGSYAAGASPYGCLDMAGNVWQWCLGGDETHRPLRGSGYDTDSRDLRFTQVAGRGFMHGEGRLDMDGFRVASRHRLKLP